MARWLAWWKIAPYPTLSQLLTVSSKAAFWHPLFSRMFAIMLLVALSTTDAGITVRYRCDGRFFDLRRLKAKTKVLEALLRDFLLFADDCALAA